MPTYTRFEEIPAWQSARQLTNLIYRVTGEGLLARDFGLRDQLRRAAVSIMSNIAEGFENQTTAQFISYLYRSKGSAGEIRAQLYVALDAGLISAGQFDQLFRQAESCSRQLSKFIAYLETQRQQCRVRDVQAHYAEEIPEDAPLAPPSPDCSPLPPDDPGSQSSNLQSSNLLIK